MKILIDNGHGADDLTQGKCSPPVADMINVDGKPLTTDPSVYGGRFREGNFNRLVAALVVSRLAGAGLDAECVVQEQQDISLGERVRRVNNLCRTLGASNVLFVSIHANAAAVGNLWTAARGFSVHVARRCSEASLRLGRIFTDTATEMKLLGNRSVPAEKVWRNDFYVIKNTLCPAVLTENLFYDNKDDIRFIASPTGRAKIAELHTRAILKYMGK